MSAVMTGLKYAMAPSPLRPAARQIEDGGPGLTVQASLMSGGVYAVTSRTERKHSNSRPALGALGKLKLAPSRTWSTSRRSHTRRIAGLGAKRVMMFTSSRDTPSYIGVAGAAPAAIEDVRTGRWAIQQAEHEHNITDRTAQTGLGMAG